MDIPQMEATLKKQIDQVGTKIDELRDDWNKSYDEDKAAVQKEIDDLKERSTKLEALLEKSERQHVPGVELGKNAEPNKFSLARATQVMTGQVSSKEKCVGKFKDHGYEIEVFTESEKGIDSLDESVKFAINAATGASGAFLLPTEINQELQPEIEARMIAAQLGVRSVQGLQGNVLWTRDEGGITAEYIDTEAEETGSESKPGFSQFEIRPHVLAAFVPMTWAMVTQPAIALESWLRTRIAKKIALRKDKSIFKGKKSLKEPRGIINDPDLLTAISFSGVTYSGASQDVTDKIMDMVGALAQANTLDSSGQLGFAAQPKTVTKLGKSKDADGNPLFFLKGDIQAARLRALMGYKMEESTQLDESDSDAFLLFGDFEQVMDANWGSMVFAASQETETNFRKLRTTLRAVTAHDVGIFQGKSFVKATALDVT